MKLRLLPLALAGLAVVAAGCSRGDDDAARPPRRRPPDRRPASTKAPAAAAPPPAAFAAKVGESALGKILAGTDGLTLYGFVNDVDAISTCYSTCAEAWPPVIVGEEWTVGPGLDTGIFSTTRRDDGTLQLVAGKFPLYGFGGDAAPGDLTGQGSGDVWFAVALDGTLITEDAGAPAEAAAPATPPPGAAGARPDRADRARRRAGRRGRADAVRVHQGRRRAPDLRRRLRRCVAAAARRWPRPAGRPRPRSLLRRRA